MQLMEESISHISNTTLEMNCEDLERKELILFWRAAIMVTWQTRHHYAFRVSKEPIHRV